MSRRRVIALIVGGVLLGVAAWAVTSGLWLRESESTGTTGSGAASTSPSAVARITATLYYASEDGQTLIGVRREVPFAEGVVAQGRAIVAAQLEEAPAPRVSVIPAGTAIRAFYLTDRGDAFVDLTREVSSKHQGGTSAELLTVYAIVNAVTANLPTVQRVQILIDGNEADTLAGHVDLRRPLKSDLGIVIKDQ